MMLMNVSKMRFTSFTSFPRYKPRRILDVCKKMLHPEHLKYLEDVGGDDDLDYSGLVGGRRELQLLVLIVNAELMGAVAPPPWSWGVT